MINWIQPAKPGHQSHETKSMFRLSNQRGGSNARLQCCIFIHEKAMKELRWVIGDKVVFALDGGCVYLKRVPKDGFTLSAATGGKKSEAIGKMVSASVKSSKHVFGFANTVYINEYATEGDVVKLTYKETV